MASHLKLVDPSTGEVMEFNPSKYLVQTKGNKEYLEVKWRLVWLRLAYPDATITTKLEQLDHQTQFALFSACVTLPGGASATGWGSETKADFGDYIEKAETKALGRALAAAGFGTQFCDDHEFDATGERVVDSPVERGPKPATDRQMGYLYRLAGDEKGWSEGAITAELTTRYGTAAITSKQASEFIDWLTGKGAPATNSTSTTTTGVSTGSAPIRPTNGNGNGGQSSPANNPAGRANPSPSPAGPSDPGKATPAQVRAIYLIARDQHGLSEMQVDERCRAEYGCLPSQLSKSSASVFITGLKN